MVALARSTRMPAWFITHGGGEALSALSGAAGEGVIISFEALSLAQNGADSLQSSPLPLLGDRHHSEIVQHWKGLAATLPAKPEAVLMVSGHWEERKPTVNVSSKTSMLYDFGGFPKEAYKIQYGAPGSPAIAHRVLNLLRKAGFQTGEESKRGLDHGAFVPLKVIFPDADVPIVTLSLLSSLDAQKHIELGRAVSSLRDEGILIIGSGSSYHNFGGLNWNGGPASEESKIFDAWLEDSLAGDHSPEERTKLLAGWSRAPCGRAAHPREEHLLPAHVALGSANGEKAEVMFQGDFLGTRISSYCWQ